MNRQDSAEILALQALSWLLGQPDDLAGFLNATGAAPSDLATAARDPHFLAALVDYILQSDECVLACAAGLEVPPTALAEARMGLPGGRDPHWT